MDVLLIEPEKAPCLKDIPGDLESLQQIVGGYIEVVYPYEDPVALVCNEEGKLLGLPLNRKLEDYDIIAGPFLICGLSDTGFAALSHDLFEKYYKKFACPELFLRLGSEIVTVPLLQEEPPAVEPAGIGRSGG